jgi:Tfp pilus assembly protein PilF
LIAGIDVSYPAQAFALALGLCLAPFASAVPYSPSTDDAVLERLPERSDPSLREIKQLRVALDSSPRDAALAVRLARRAIEACRETGDPRFLGQAQAALAPWWAHSDPPAPVLLLRATIRQSFHDFTGAIADLDRLIASNPADGQALLTRATVLAVTGKYVEARADCNRIARLTIQLVVAGCLAGPESLSGQAEAAYRSLVDALARAPNADPGLREWALTLAADIAQRRGDAAMAESHFRAALSLDPRDPYLRAAYADFLLEQQRPSEVVSLLNNNTRNDSLLLRLALAEARLPDLRADFDIHRADLAARFDAARRRGDSLHRREEARYALELAHDPAAALKLARENWRVQHEVADLRILVAAAVAAGDSEALQEARRWAESVRLEDAVINTALARKP